MTQRSRSDSAEVLNPPDYIIREWFVSAMYECLDAAGVDTFARYHGNWANEHTARELVNEVVAAIEELRGIR